MVHLRKILKCVSLTAAMFVFQACYGTGYDRPDAIVTFRVLSAEDNSPIPDVKVIAQPQSNDESYEYDWSLVGFTDSTGVSEGGVAMTGLDTKFRFSDKDSLYAVKDTVISVVYGGMDTVDIFLSRIK